MTPTPNPARGRKSQNLPGLVVDLSPGGVCPKSCVSGACVIGSCARVAGHCSVLLRGVPAEELSGLEGQRFEGVLRHGKWLVARTRSLTLLLHFGMTGRLRWEPRDTEPGRFDRVEFHLADGRLVYQDQRNLGTLSLADSSDEVRQTMGDLGPDALEVTAQDMQERFTGSRSLKTLLMDQSVLAGLGNMLSDEVLWRARLHPGRRFEELDADQLRELERSLHRVLRASVKAAEIPRKPSWLASQRARADPYCPRCRTRLRTSRIAGRTAHWCPVCQVLPAATGEAPSGSSS
jgi:formamidopyrimidine-DNA glycosylase